MERRLSRRACTERECHTYTDTWSVCVWVCVCVSAQKGKPSCSTGGGLGDRMAIHSQRRGVCVWQKGKPSCSTGGGGGRRVLLPPWPARTVGKPHNRMGGGRGCGGKQSTKSRLWGKEMPQKQRDILFPPPPPPPPPPRRGATIYR